MKGAMPFAAAARRWLHAVAFAGILIIAASAGLAAGAYWTTGALLRERSRILMQLPTVVRFADENARLREHPRRVVLFGDSRISQWSPVLQLEGWEVVNRGIAGDTIRHMRHRFAQDVLALWPRAVVIQAGINDLVAAATLGMPEAQASEQVLEGVDAMLAAARDSGVEVFLMSIVRPGPVEVWRLPFWPRQIASWVEHVNDGLRKRAGHGVELIDADAMLRQGESRIAHQFAADTLHFTVPAYSLMNSTVIDRLRARFNALQ
jgi:lysophospholipase L1-like esterase